MAAAAGTVLALAGGAAANATITTITWTGVVSSGTDATEVFGSGTDLAGKSFTFVQTVDDSVGATRQTIAGLSDSISGGTAYGGPSPSTGKFTIGGVTVDISGEFAGRAITYNYSSNPASEGYNYLYSDVQQYSYSPGLYNDVTLTAITYHNLFGNSPLLDAPESLDLTHRFGGTETASGIATFQQTDARGLTTENINLKLDAQTYTVAGAGAAPEPATWALMIVGVGGMGAALRTRRRKVVA